MATSQAMVSTFSRPQTTRGFLGNVGGMLTQRTAHGTLGFHLKSKTAENEAM
eukprot:CAMPEP_0194545104 /NCGR_PEP_ID=MMETSP0253-20130528/88622_1 /TAXON_ID=2966 /ORGANISM="Noctiluca scintillans" /LENGTH=51 /DNA_ID=CAMNT_0039392069 /DNA_START=487 /DNA_END=639 /DNA_ORIENTATION=+